MALLNHINNTLLVIKRCHYFILLAVLLFIPLYYSSRAALILWPNPQVDCDEGTDNDIADVPLSSFATLNDTLEMTCVAQPAPVHLDTHSSNRKMQEPFLDIISEVADGPMARLQSRWQLYLNFRCNEWTSITTSAGAIAIASLTVLQIAGIHDHPITRHIIFLAIFRAVAAVIHGIIMLFYFQQDTFRTSKFAEVWEQYVEQNKASILSGPWTILALSGICIAWAVVFLLMALFYHIWQTVLSSGLEGSSVITQHWATFILPILVTLLTALDIASIAWAIRILRRLKDRIPGDSSIPRR